MTTPDTPDAAYEAAAIAIHDRECADGSMCTATPTSMTRYADLARRAVDAVWPLARAETLKTAARSLLAEAEAYHEKWIRPANIITSDWDNGYVAGMKRAAHDVDNSIDRIEDHSTKEGTS